MHATNQVWIDKDHTIKQGAGMHVALICNKIGYSNVLILENVIFSFDRITTVS